MKSALNSKFLRVPFGLLLPLCTALVFSTVCTAGTVAQTFTVDCSSGDSISAALAKGDTRKPLVLNIRGTCHEAVLINRDNVTLQGDPRATIAPQDDARAIEVSGHDINLANLDVVGGNLGISFAGTLRVVATNCTVHGSNNDGIRVFSGDARLQGILVENAGGYGISLQRRSSLAISNASEISSNQLDGIYATLNSTVSINGSSIHDNGGYGAKLENGAEGSFLNTSIEGNEQGGVSVSQGHAFVGQSLISGNNGVGVGVLAGANAAVDGNTITGNAADGVGGYLGATVVMHGNQISANGQAGVSCNSHCTLQIGDGADISGNNDAGIVLMRGSVLIIEETGAVSHDNGSWGLWCGDTESRVGGLEYLTGSASELCEGFSN